MIEVEKRFLLTPEEQSRLLDGAVFQWEKTHEDTYYDTANFRMTTQDWWLRNRSGNFELKIGKHTEAPGATDTYEELDDDPSILRALNVPSAVLNESVLREHGFVPFCTLTTRRRRYAKEGFAIDCDETTSDEYRFSCCEIECMVASLAERDTAAERIMQFAKRHALLTRAFRGKVFEYIFQFRPMHYRALVQAKVINS